MFIDKNGCLYIGDMVLGDREATQEEIDNYLLSKQASEKLGLKVTMRQARLALLQAGLLQTVNDAIAAMPGIEGDAARIEWEFSSEVHRNKALVQSLAPVIGMTDTQLDQLFATASTL